MSALAKGDVVSVEISDGNIAVGVIYNISAKVGNSGPYYYLNFPGKTNDRILRVVPFNELQLTFIATKEQYLLTNPEFFL